MGPRRTEAPRARRAIAESGCIWKRVRACVSLALSPGSRVPTPDKLLATAHRLYTGNVPSPSPVGPPRLQFEVWPDLSSTQQARAKTCGWNLCPTREPLVRRSLLIGASMRHGYIGNNESDRRRSWKAPSAYADKSLDHFINSGDAENGCSVAEREDRHRWSETRSRHRVSRDPVNFYWCPALFARQLLRRARQLPCSPSQCAGGDGAAAATGAWHRTARALSDFAVNPY